MVTGSIKFLQVNLQKAKLGQIEMGGRIKELNKKGEPFICFIQEPQVFKNSLAGQPTSCNIQCVQGACRSVIYHSNNLHVWFLEHLSDKDTTVSQTRLGGKSTVIISSYFDINYEKVVPENVIKAVEYAGQKGLGVLIGADTNSHSTSFGPRNNKRGEKLDDFIAKYGLQIENAGEVPTFEARGAATVIDITLSRDLGVSCKNWRVNREFNGSDHNTIEFEGSQELIEVPEKYLWSKADWDLFRETIEAKDYSKSKVITQSECDKMVEKLYEYINDGLQEAIPKSKPKMKDMNNPWWNDNLKSRRRQVNRLYQSMKKHKTSVSTDRYNNAKKEYKKACNKARLSSWEDFKEKINSVEDANKFRKIIEKHINITLGSLQKENGSLTQPGEETLDLLKAVHFPNAEPLKQTQYREDRKVKEETVAKWEPDWVNSDLVSRSLDQFKSKKSPGPDGLSPLVLKELPKVMLEYICFIYKSCLILEFTPTQWKGCRLVFIPKAGKASYSNPKAWRAISLMNYLLKGLERLCGWHMDRKLVDYPVHTLQHGFRTDRNTDTAISAVVDYIEQGIFNQKYVIGVFLDIQAAFDTIDPESIRKALLKHGASEIMVNWYYHFITHRNIYLKVKDAKVEFSTSLGFPQGGVCSAKFWIVAYNQALNIINSHGAFGNGFADDSVTLIMGTNLHQMMSRLQKVVTELEGWGAGAGLKFNAGKTEVIVFTRKMLSSDSYPNKLKVGGQNVDFGSTAKYLGVTLDSKLTWNKHFQANLDKAKRYLFTIRSVVQKGWGPKPQYIKWIYTAIVRSRLTYGCVAWGHVSSQAHKKELLNKLNRLAAVMITPVRRSTPIKAMEIIYDLMPLHLYIQHEAIASIIRNMKCLKLTWEGENSKYKTYIGHLKYWYNKIYQKELSLGDIDRTVELAPPKCFTINAKSFESSELPIQAQVNIYTDGSKTENHVGAGYVIMHLSNKIAEGSYRLPEDTTVFMAEVYAINRAAKHLKEVWEDSMRYVKIFSDSRAAIMALDKQIFKSKTIVKAAKELNNLGEMLDRLEINWIKAHVGYDGNERADELARLAVNWDVIEDIARPTGLIMNTLWAKLYEDWAEEWQDDKTCRMTKQFIVKPDKEISRRILHFSRSKMRRLLEIITGHNNLNYFQQKIDALQSSLCRFCEEEDETFFHLVTECPCFIESRAEIFQERIITGTRKWEMEKLIEFSHEAGIEEALDTHW
jgi:ribonuclease HI